MYARFEIFRDLDGKLRFRLRAPNGEILAVSEGFESKEALVQTLRRVKEFAPEAILVG
jgi:uncharacterized protein YegP (UPF0339 family)